MFTKIEICDVNIFQALIRFVICNICEPTIYYLVIQLQYKILCTCVGKCYHTNFKSTGFDQPENFDGKFGIINYLVFSITF